MNGLMQDWPLTVPSVLAHAERNHAEQTVHSRTVEGPMHVYKVYAAKRLMARYLLEKCS